MGKHIFVCYQTFMGEFGRSLAVTEKHFPKNIAKACTESFTIGENTFHYQPEYKEDALAYLESQGVKPPANDHEP